MKSERWARIQYLFDIAVDLDPVERRRFLARECEGDDALRFELERLLRAEVASKAEAFIGSAIRSAARELVEPGTRTGDRLDEYRLVRELGRGGMGAVWLAERADGEYTAKVAIKVVTGGVAAPDTERRFRSERQILADLAHPNIARLIDGGTTPDGRPYLVMEYIDGEPITGWVARQALPLRDRLRLFLTVCDAVHSAHAALVVHRDLKPSNILVRSDGTPKLVDFGIAKILSPPGSVQETLSMVRLLTPSYASPEQLAGERITVAADTWALGVLLYELLTSTHPFSNDHPSPLELRRRILEMAPEAPSSRIASAEANGVVRPRDVRGDLDAITLLAMSKHADHRYTSVAALGEDVRRFLDGDPVNARMGSWRYLAAKFVRRRAGLLGGTALVLTLLGGLGASWTFRLAAQRDAALDHAARAADVSRYIARFLAGPADSLPLRPAAAIELAIEGIDNVIADPLTRAGVLHSIADALREAGEDVRAGQLEARAAALEAGGR